MSEQELIKAAAEKVRLNGSKKLAWQILTALFCTVGSIISFTWVGRGFVDDLKQTVTDNATKSKSHTDSLWIQHDYQIKDIRKDLDEVVERHKDLVKDFNNYLHLKNQPR